MQDNIAHRKAIKEAEANIMIVPNVKMPLGLTIADISDTYEPIHFITHGNDDRPFCEQAPLSITVTGPTTYNLSDVTCLACMDNIVEHVGTLRERVEERNKS